MEKACAQRQQWAVGGRQRPFQPQVTLCREDVDFLAQPRQLDMLRRIEVDKGRHHHKSYCVEHGSRPALWKSTVGAIQGSAVLGESKTPPQSAASNSRRSIKCAAFGRRPRRLWVRHTPGLLAVRIRPESTNCNHCPSQKQGYAAGAPTRNLFIDKTTPRCLKMRKLRAAFFLGSLKLTSAGLVVPVWWAWNADRSYDFDYLGSAERPVRIDRDSPAQAAWGADDDDALSGAHQSEPTRDGAGRTLLDSPYHRFRCGGGFLRARTIVSRLARCDHAALAQIVARRNLSSCSSRSSGN